MLIAGLSDKVFGPFGCLLRVSAPMGKKRRRENLRAEGQTAFRMSGEANENITISAGVPWAVEHVFEHFMLGDVLDVLKREQGTAVSDALKVLVAQSMQMVGMSVNAMEAAASDPRTAELTGTGVFSQQDLYRTIGRVGENSDAIVRHLCSCLKGIDGIGMDTVFTDWTSMCFDAQTNRIVRFGHSRDHRPDLPQVMVGLSVDKETGMPVGLTVNRGNMLDVTHFSLTFAQIRPFLDEGTMIVFDNGAYSKDNVQMVRDAGCDFLSRLELNSSDLEKTMNSKGWEMPEEAEGMMCRKEKGSLGVYRYMFFSHARKEDAFRMNRSKAERDYDEMQEMKLALAEGKKPRKKHRHRNIFVKTTLSHSFPLDVFDRREAVNEAVKRMRTGREGFFMLVSSKDMTPWDALTMYRSRNDVEANMKDLKHGIDWRPARSTNPESVKGRILIAFLSLFIVSYIRWKCPDASAKTADSIVKELTSLSVTGIYENGKVKKRIYSNFSPLIRSMIAGLPMLVGQKQPPNKHPAQTKA